MLPYKRLLVYRYAEIISDLVTPFIKKYISPRSRTYDQMEQADRSGKQNIIEGYAQGAATSKKGELKLYGVASASYEELIADLEDFLRKRNLPIYPKTDPNILAFRQKGYRLSSLGNLSNLGFLKEKGELPGNPTDDANFLLTLVHMETYLLSRLIAAKKQEFIERGGFTENLFRDRFSNREPTTSSRH